MSFDAAKMMQAVSAGAGTIASGGIRSTPRQLSPLAQLAAAQPLAPAFSPIVVAGIVRLVEFALIALIGTALYFGYVYSAYGHVFDWYYVATAFGVAALALIAFLVIVALVFFAQLGGMYSRLWLTTYYGVGLFALYAGRLALFAIVRSWTREGRLDRR